MGFFSAKPTVDDDDLEWQLETWAWLLDNLGGLERLRTLPLALPMAAHFPPSGKTGEEHVRHVLAQVCDWIGVDLGDVQLVEQEGDVDPAVNPLTLIENVPRQGALGTYSSSTEQHVITYHPQLLDDLEGLIATLAHEVCHPILFQIPEAPPGGEDNEEFATDLAVAFFGFGIFGGNSAFRFQQFSDAGSGSQGWSTNRAGYLSQNEWGLALAVREYRTSMIGGSAEKLMTSGLAANMKKNRKFLGQNSYLIEPLLEIS